MLKRIIALYLIAFTAYGADFTVNFSDLQSADWVETGVGEYRILWSDIGGVTPPALWTDTNNPSMLHYAQALQPSNCVLEVVSGHNLLRASTHPGGWWQYPDGYLLEQDYMTNASLPDTLGNGVTAISYAGWIKLDDVIGAHGIQSIGNGTSQPECGLFSNGDDLVVRLNENAKNDTAANVFSADEWAHVGFTYDTTNLVLYVNGTNMASDTYAVALDFAGKIYQSGSIIKQFPMEGNVAQQFVYNRNLLGSEMTTLYQAGHTGTVIDTISQTGLLAYYPFTNDNTSVHDVTGNNAVLDVFPTYDNSPTIVAVLTNDNGVVYAYDFDGVDDSMKIEVGTKNTTVDQITDIGTNAFTLGVWFMVDEVSAEYTLAGRVNGNTAVDGFGLWSGTTAATNYLRAKISDGIADQIPADIAITTNEWHFGLMRRKAIAAGQHLVDLYYDGSWQSTTQQENHIVNLTVNDLYNISDDAKLNGKIMEHRFYPTALGNSAVDDIYNNTGTNNNENRIVFP